MKGNWLANTHEDCLLALYRDEVKNEKKKKKKD
jgi:hypothetical protein